MAASGLIGIRRRIKSVTNIRKITKAMGLVATAKLRKARVNLEVNRKYYNAYRESMDTIVNSMDEKSIYINGNNSEYKLYVILTSDSGLCGSFNMNVINRSVDEIKKDKEKSKIIVVGQRGRNYLKRLKINTLAEYVEIPDVPTLKEARIIEEHILKLYNSKEVGEVYIVYSEFYSPVKQEIKIEKLLPFNRGEVDSNKYIEFNPQSDKLLEIVTENYIKGSILNFLLNSKASEIGSRMTAMNGATDNANDLLSNLNLKFNRLRQSAITQEISEIVGGAEAQR
ncbi:ATP synthase F1 subunit gamma [Clostridium niameyense]|uniref:ATP synthase F1 subunit gamma n=1 Tax=Clostridium niameyense TaxID=1622073 RepID=UPI00067F6710|nr:ATP synthase F1 subunit gamma [Clostridium niameyense]